MFVYLTKGSDKVQAPKFVSPLTWGMLKRDQNVKVNYLISSIVVKIWDKKIDFFMILNLIYVIVNIITIKNLYSY